jgi:hypothetical protein
MVSAALALDPPFRNRFVKGIGKSSHEIKVFPVICRRSPARIPLIGTLSGIL